MLVDELGGFAMGAAIGGPPWGDVVRLILSVRIGLHSTSLENSSDPASPHQWGPTPGARVLLGLRGDRIKEGRGLSGSKGATVRGQRSPGNPPVPQAASHRSQEVGMCKADLWVGKRGKGKQSFPKDACE